MRARPPAAQLTQALSSPPPLPDVSLSDTASTLQCSMGPGLPNNRVIVRKTPQAIFLQHGTGNATIVSQPIPYCGGEAYLVNQVLVPCGDVSAIMGEIANVLSPCKNNVEVGQRRRVEAHAGFGVSRSRARDAPGRQAGSKASKTHAPVSVLRTPHRRVSCNVMA